MGWRKAYQMGAYLNFLTQRGRAYQRGGLNRREA